MGKFLRASRTGEGRTSHDHIVYLASDSAYGLCSVNAGHSHELLSDMEGNLSIGPGPDGHMHEMSEIIIKKKQTKEEEYDVVRDVLALYKAALENEGKSIESAKEADKFYCGEQWEEDVKGHLNNLNRACLSINLVERHVDQLSGYQREQRGDIHYIPVEGGDQVACDILNGITKTILHNCFFEREESKAFEDEVITGRGFLNVFISFDKDLRGEPVIERFPWDQVVCGPHEKDDLSDCEYIVKSKMFSKANVKRLWPKIANEVERNFGAVAGGDSIVHENSSYDKYLQGESVYPIFISGDGYRVDMLDIATKEIRLLECWRKVYTKRSVAVKNDGLDIIPLDDWSSRDIDSIRTLVNDFTVIEQSVPKMRITKIVGGKVAADENPADLPIDDFYIVPVYAKKRGAKFWGKVESVKDLQKEINHRHSQSVDIGNKCAGYHYFIDPTTFPDERELKKFKEYSTSPGQVFTVQSLERKPVQSEGVKFPGEIVELMNVAQEQFRELMNIVVIPSGANESGSHFMQQEKLRLTGNEFLFDNLSFAKKKIGILLAHIVRRYYTPERILRILNTQNQKEQVDINGQPLSAFTEEQLLDFINNADLTAVDVEITESSFSPSHRMALSMYLNELAQAGQPIPADVIIEFADIPEAEKRKIIESITAQQQAQAEQTNAAGQSEILKTVISKTGVIPPVVQQQLGIDAQGQATAQQQQQQDGGQVYQGDGSNQALAGIM